MEHNNNNTTEHSSNEKKAPEKKENEKKETMLPDIPESQLEAIDDAHYQRIAEDFKRLKSLPYHGKITPRSRLRDHL